MEITDSIKVKNYKCFGDTPQGFGKILPINVIIGKNNSGKSSLIDLIQYTTSPNRDFVNDGRGKDTAEVIISHLLMDSELASIFPSNTHGGVIQGNHYEYGKKFIGCPISYILEGGGARKPHEYPPNIIPETENDFRRLVSSNELRTPLSGNSFYRITAERNIVPETVQHENLNLLSDGTGATRLITQIVNKAKYDSRIIEDLLLSDLNRIVKPDMQFMAIVPQQHDNGNWEIFFEESDGNRIALSKMGSGLKTIILVLLNVIVQPKLQGKLLEDCVFAFEELENNLHPSLQRRLFNYLLTFARENESILFITTHSNVVIDIFGNNDDSQIVHVQKNGNLAVVKNILTVRDSKQILRDLDVRASDLLQSNGVIWVEGPSDRNYINRWLYLAEPSLIEGVHYSIMFYGGRLLANLCFDYEWLQRELIPLLKINSNAFVVIDKDGKTANAKLNQTKARIQYEIGENNCWITKGREIENYLSERILLKWLNGKHGITGSIEVNSNEKLEDLIQQSINGIKLKYNTDKIIFSQELCEYITDSDLDVLDLRQKISSLASEIKLWNSQLI